MSTHRLIFGRRRIFGLPAFSVLAGLLLALQLWLPAPVMASPRPDSAPTQSVARAGVSVVRLLVYYAVNKAGDAPSTKPTAVCTGLGVLLSSQLKPETTTYENWVLTDGWLVNAENVATCLDASPAATLVRIEVYTSSAYNSQPFLLATINKPADNKPLEVSCRTRPAKCPDGLAAFSFPTAAPQPFIDFSDTVSSSGSAVVTHQALQLTSSTGIAGGLSASSQDAAHFADYSRQAQTFLQPTMTASVSNRLLESGTPFVDDNGSLAGLFLSNAPEVKASDIQAFVKNESTVPKTVAGNPVHDNWKSGMDAYYIAHSTTDARAAFARAFGANPRFEAAQRFAALSSVPVVTQARKASAPDNETPSLLQRTLPVAGFQIPYLLLAAVAAVFLVLLLVLLLALLSNLARRRRKRILAAELADAERRATVEAQHIAEIEARQNHKAAYQADSVNAVSSAQAQPEAPVQYSPLSQQAVGDQESFSSVPTMLLCPRCGEQLASDANFCPNCRLQLSPTESGLHLRVAPPHSPAPMRTPAASAPFSTQPLAGLPVAEQPTVDMSKNTRDAKGDLEKTVPYAVRHLNGQHLGFVVGTRSDPGIKRKYKPNEDSLFAAQGLISQSSPQLFGLFVVADGMGGHANGEDASRLAIQTIADYMLPRLTKSAAGQGEQYAQLLVEGIQKANLAVHQSNTQQHGDMGTTVTATLLVDTVAYVANVGDSRTYLYRPSQGLKKVTVDHSVVASLVEAGIIKPDDIYTHPKRNQIYRSLGEKAVVEVDSFTVQLQAGDKLLLCSDGLWDMVRDPQIEAVIKNADTNPSVTGDALIQSALEGGGEDNVSVIVVHITDAVKAGAMPRFQLLTKPDSVQMPQL
ncbi:MAG: hypothetical protein NVSMB44_13380 [Ktedonobacteraceae bacterium]